MINEYQKKYRSKNIDRIRELNRLDYSRHKEKRRETAKRYLANNRLTINHRARLRRRGITQEQFNTINTGKCHICGKKEIALLIDHNHTNNEVRGMLCKRCNTALGYMDDDMFKLHSAAKYLQNHPTDTYRRNGH